MSEFWKRKIRKYFSTMDFDSDGIISRDDYIGIAIQFAKSCPAHEQKGERMKTNAEKAWELFAKNDDKGRKSTMTPDEFIDSVGNLRYDPDLMKVFSEVMHIFHDMLDVNRDGYLQEEEYERLVTRCGVPDPSFAKKAFKAIDVNGDGKLSVEEFTHAFIDFMFSEDEKSPFAFFFGPLDD